MFSFSKSTTKTLPIVFLGIVAVFAATMLLTQTASGQTEDCDPNAPCDFEVLVDNYARINNTDFDEVYLRLTWTSPSSSTRPIIGYTLERSLYDDISDQRLPWVRWANFPAAAT